MFCKNCGTQINDDAAFCIKCGKRTDENKSGAGKSGNSGKSGKPALSLQTIIIAALGVVVVALIVILCLHNCGGSSAPAAENNDDAVMDTLAAVFTAAEEKDFREMANLMHPDVIAEYTEYGGISKSEVAQHIVWASALDGSQGMLEYDVLYKYTHSTGKIEALGRYSDASDISADDYEDQIDFVKKAEWEIDHEFDDIIIFTIDVHDYDIDDYIFVKDNGTWYFLYAYV